MAAYYQTFTIEGSFPFPLDMLRYDSCFPATQKDVSGISQSIERTNTEPVVKVRLGRLITNKGERPTEARWRSFGWKVSDIHIRKY